MDCGQGSQGKGPVPWSNWSHLRWKRIENRNLWIFNMAHQWAHYFKTVVLYDSSVPNGSKEPNECSPCPENILGGKHIHLVCVLYSQGIVDLHFFFCAQLRWLSNECCVSLRCRFVQLVCSLTHTQRERVINEPEALGNIHSANYTI